MTDLRYAPTDEASDALVEKVADLVRSDGFGAIINALAEVASLDSVYLCDEDEHDTAALAGRLSERLMDAAAALSESR